MIDNLSADHLDSVLNDALVKKNYKAVLEVAAMTNNSDYVKYLLTSDELEYNPDIETKDGAPLYWACHHGNLELVRYLLTSPDLKKTADINSGGMGLALNHACASGHLHIVDYLLCSPELDKHADIDLGTTTALGYACAHGQIEVVKYLLTSPKLKVHANPHYAIRQIDESVPSNWAGFKDKYSTLVCTALGNSPKSIEIIDYLISSSDLKENVDIHEGDDILFKNLCTYGKYEIIEHLVLSGKLEQNQEIEKFLEENPNKRIETIFNMRKLNGELTNKNSTTSKTLKL